MVDEVKARQTAQDMASTVREEARRTGESVAEEAKAVADEAATRGREHAEQRFEQGKGALEDQVSTIRSAVDGAAKRLDDENSPLASYAGELSDQIARFSSGIENSSLDDVAIATRRVARENPGLFVLGSVVAGIAAGRFFKASSSRDHERDHDDRDDDYRAGREAAMARHRIDYRPPAGGAGSSPYRRDETTAPATNAAAARSPGRVPMDSTATGQVVTGETTTTVVETGKGNDVTGGR